MTIKLSEICPISNQFDFKIHAARWNQHEHPLDTFIRSRDEWKGWQEYRPGRDEFNRLYIFSIIQFYMEPDTWLFGGIWKIVGRQPDCYLVELDEKFEKFIGRLKLRFAYRSRATRINLENWYDEIDVSELLPEIFSGRPFSGYDEIDIGFSELESIVKNMRSDWHTALGHMKGVYLITDTSTKTHPLKNNT